MADAPIDPSPDAALTDRVGAELKRISTSADFARAPMMRRLLDFLVRETLAGRGDQLKAYAVAVDGLGRPADFDAQTDSYPRVQVGRLRRMLDAFYAREPHPEGFRLGIPQGRYRVAFVVQEPEPPPAEPASLEEADAAPAVDRRWRPIHVVVAGLAVALVATVAALAMLLWPHAASTAPSAAPSLALAHLDADPAFDALEVDADAILLDGLRRSWLVAVLPQTGGNLPRADYVLSGAIAGPSAIVRLRLARTDTGELLWTGQAPVPPDRARLRQALDPLVAELIQPYGVIATDQRARLKNPVGAGYPCQLRFDQYRRERSRALHAESVDCIDRTLARMPLDAMALAAKAFLTLDDEIYRFAPAPGSRDRALALARRAVAADPYSPFAHIVLARASRHNGGCAVAVRSARRAIVLNPADPDLLALAANSFFNCGDPGAEAAARRAIALDPAPPANFYTTLVFSALERGDVAAARQAAAQMTPGPNAAPGYYDFVFAVVAAAEGDGNRARAAWRRMLRAEPAAARDLAGTFRRWSTPPRIEATGLRYLRSVGIAQPA